MEAVAAIASIAGIVSLVGQTLGQIAKLRGFYQECSEASGSVRRFLKALNGLIQIHEDVRDLMRKLENTTAADANQNILASLQIQINDCGKDVGLWLEKASACQPMFGSGTRATFRKFLVALEQRKIVDIYQEIANHRGNITTKLSVVGRHLDISQSTALEKISTKIDEAAKAHKLTTEAFERRDAYLFFNNPDLNNGPASLASIAGSLNRIESALGSRNGSAESYASFQSTTYELELPSFTESRYKLFQNTLLTGELFGDSCGDISPSFEIGDTTPDHPLNQNVSVQADGLRYCQRDDYHPFQHKPEKLRDNYNKFVDSHLKPYRCKVTGCEELSFPSTACLLCHEREAHNMHGHGDKILLCTYEECDRAVPGNGFPRHWELRDHMRRVRNDIEPPDSSSNLPLKGGKRKADSRLDSQPTKKPSFLDFNAIITRKARNCLSSRLNDYIRLLHLRSTMKTWIEGIGAMPWIFSENEEEGGINQDADLVVQLQRVESEIDTTRKACWAAGENVDDIEILLKIKDEYSTNTPWEPPQTKMIEQEDEIPALQRDLDGKMIIMVASKQDQISLWLLEILRGSPNEAIRHRSYLGASADVDDQEWARAVLQYWLLDGAAVRNQEQAASTNGAVDSAGMCHSARVVFGNHLPFPLTEADKGLYLVKPLPANLAQKKILLEGDEMSLTSTRSTRSLAHRQKRKRY